MIIENDKSQKTDMTNIHLVLDEKFINNSVDLFEYYYPGKNYFFVNRVLKDCKFVTPKSNVFFIPFDTPQWLERVREIVKTDLQSINILVHYLTKQSALRAMELKSLSIYNRLYWMFYGADLYDYLSIRYNYQLYDYKKIGIGEKVVNKLRIVLNRFKYIEDFSAVLDYFCFWNPYDYQLLCSYLKTKASFKNFYYVMNAHLNLNDSNEQSIGNKILINHSGSWTGNHLTILQALKKLDLTDKSIVLPLSYGPREHIEQIEKEVEVLFPGKYEIIKDFLPIQSYYKIIDECQYAIMGHRRQEAGGNLSFLLRSGKKVFLREDNSLFKFYKDVGYYVYSFEKDLFKEDAFTPLSSEQKQHNREVFRKRVQKENIDNMMLNLFK